eukprot:4701844-Pleurochrysis_carterae.AAC.1
MSRRALPHAARLQAAQCVHGTDGNSAVAHGRYADGRSRARAAAAYPPTNERGAGGYARRGGGQQ